MVVESLRAIGRLIPRKYGHGRRAIGYSFRVRRKELSTGVEEEYAMLVKNGRIIADSHQLEVVKRLSKVQGNVMHYCQAKALYQKEKRLINDKYVAAIRGLEAPTEQRSTDSQKDDKTSEHELVLNARAAFSNELKQLEMQLLPRVPRGLYLHGDVGSGKTFLMDLFYQAMKENNQSAQLSQDFVSVKSHRTHFYAFMTALYSSIHEIKAKVAVSENSSELFEHSGKEDLISEEQAIKQAAEDLANKYDVLCFDEFFVDNIYDAMVAKTFFTTLFARGVVIVLTSNIAPEKLYWNKLNRHYFLPFVDTLTKFCRVVPLTNGIDYREVKSQGTFLVDETAVQSSQSSGLSKFQAALLRDKFFAPITGTEQKDDFEAVLSDLCGDQPAVSKQITIAFGRTLDVHECYHDPESPSTCICVFEFEDICSDKVPVMGPADFEALCDHFSTIVVKNVPLLGTTKNKNQTRRFITLIDITYDRRKTMLLSSVHQLSHLIYAPTEADTGAMETERDEVQSALKYDKDLAIASKRMISRLTERDEVQSALKYDKDLAIASKRMISRLTEMRTKGWPAL